jgi:U3 small nucleolar RNA-associated protein 6
MNNDDELKRKARKDEFAKEHSRQKRPRHDGKQSATCILEDITLSSDHGGLISAEDFLDTFCRYKIAYIPNAKGLLRKESSTKSDSISVSDIFDVFQNASQKDQETWTQETLVEDEDGNSKEEHPGSFLKTSNTQQRGYCSFVLQHTKLELEKVLERLPFSDLPVSAACIDADAASNQQQPLRVTYGPGLWIFFGRNSHGEEALQGRVEHTDSIQHDGTWHYQLSGTKEWHLRPSMELLKIITETEKDGDKSDILSIWNQEQERGEKDNCTRMTIRCQQGDILVVNTRLWWHSTTLPVQPTVSLSYARDMYLSSSPPDDDVACDPSSMTNVDGLYAANDIEAGTIIFRESEMPDCELHRAKENANCEVVELEYGEGAIVSSRLIKSGEFFCILESDDDDDEGDYEEEEDEEAEDD